MKLPFNKLWGDAVTVAGEHCEWSDVGHSKSDFELHVIVIVKIFVHILNSICVPMWWKITPNREDACALVVVGWEIRRLALLRFRLRGLVGAVPASRFATITTFQMISGGEDHVRSFEVVVFRLERLRLLSARARRILAHMSILS